MHCHPWGWVAVSAAGGARGRAGPRDRTGGPGHQGRGGCGGRSALRGWLDLLRGSQARWLSDCGQLFHLAEPQFPCFKEEMTRTRFVEFPRGRCGKFIVLHSLAPSRDSMNGSRYWPLF